MEWVCVNERTLAPIHWNHLFWASRYGTGWPDPTASAPQQSSPAVRWLYKQAGKSFFFFFKKEIKQFLPAFSRLWMFITFGKYWWKIYYEKIPKVKMIRVEIKMRAPRLRASGLWFSGRCGNECTGQWMAGSRRHATGGPEVGALYTDLLSLTQTCALLLLSLTYFSLRNKRNQCSKGIVLEIYQHCFPNSLNGAPCPPPHLRCCPLTLSLIPKHWDCLGRRDMVDKGKNVG